MDNDLRNKGKNEGSHPYDNEQVFIPPNGSLLLMEMVWSENFDLDQGWPQADCDKWMKHGRICHGT